MDTLQRNISFVDADGKRARIDVEITTRNGYHELTMSASYLGSCGQCLDDIKPANKEQKRLIDIWKKYHLKNIEKVPGLTEELNKLLDTIELQEKERDGALKRLDEEELLLKKMNEEGIDEDMLEAVKAYIHIFGTDDLEDFDEAYEGEWKSDEEFVEELLDSTGEVTRDLPPYIHIDWEGTAREIMYDYSEHEGYYFRNI